MASYVKEGIPIWATLGGNIDVGRQKGAIYHGIAVCPFFTRIGIVKKGKCEDCNEEIPPGVELALRLGMDLRE